MISIGLDPSLRNFGWSVVDTLKSGKSRRIDSGHESTTVSECQPARYLHLQYLVRDVIKRYPSAEVIGIESPAFTGGPFAMIHHTLMMFSLVEIFLARKDCVLFDPATREYLVRNGKKGKMGKSDIQRFVQLDTMDTSVLQNDEADAYVIGLFAARFMEFKNDILKVANLSIAEQRVFVGRTKKVKTLSGVIEKRTAHAFRENSRFFRFSLVPQGSVLLPTKSEINPDILAYLESLTT